MRQKFSKKNFFNFYILHEINFRVADGRKKSVNFTKLHHDIGSDYAQIGILMGKAVNLEQKRFVLLSFEMRLEL